MSSTSIYLIRNEKHLVHLLNLTYSNCHFINIYAPVAFRRSSEWRHEWRHEDSFILDLNNDYLHEYVNN